MADFTPLLLLFLLLLSPASAAEFVYNHFPSSGAGPDDLLVYGQASVSGGLLALTNDSAFAIGRVLHKTKVPAKSSSSAAGAGAVLPFSTSFIFAISPLRGYSPGHGLAFLFAPVTGTGGASDAQYLGLFNLSTNGRADNHVLAVEFDLFPNPDFSDIDGNHVGLDINSLTSLASQPAGYYTTSADFVDLVLNNGENYQAWIDYRDSTINITMAPAGMGKPERPLLSETVNLSAVFEDEMYVGFCAATGQRVESHRILSWSFSNTNFSAYEALVTTNLPSFVLRDSKSGSRTFAAAISATSAALAALLLTGGYLFYARRRRRAREDIEDWELDYWPHRIEYRDIHRATRGFSDRNLIGAGGNGKVYKGVLHRTEDVAVKCIACGSDGAGIRQFLAEVSTLGRLEHRNLVPLRGWSKKTPAATAPVTTLILVYDFMPNGSLDKRIFSTSDAAAADCEALTWDARVRVLKDVASALVYMHEGWGQSKVLHRDIKASNVMLDGEMRGRLGDFGLARLQSAAAAGTTRVVGTVGYMAPELLHTGKATTETDVYGFGMLVLETITGRPPSPSPDCEAALLDWVWALWEKGESERVLDPRLARRGGYDPDEVERVVGLGLACSYPDPRARPSMREAVKLLDGPVDNLRGPVWVGKEAHFLDGESKKMNARWYLGRRAKAHPTFDELRDSLSSSATLSISDVIEDGR